MLIDCTKCPQRVSGCTDCMITALYEPPEEVERLDRDELWAIETLARAGFEVTLLDQQQTQPPLRLVGRGNAA